MKIGIDFRYYIGNESGVGTYSRGLIDALCKEDNLNMYYLLINRDMPLDYPLKLGKNFVPIIFKQKVDIIWTQHVLPRYLSKNGLDAFHGLCNFEIPIMKSCPCIITLHDLIPLLFPQLVPFKNRFLFNTLIKKAVKTADKIIVVSNSTKNDLINYLGIKEEKVRVIYNGVKDIFNPIYDMARIQKVKDIYGIDGEYILFVGVIEPKKNLQRLILAFKCLLERSEFKGIKLVISGKKGWFYKEIFAIIKKYDLSKHIVCTGYIPQEDLPVLYSGASIFVFPSIYEGFGLPVLEALRCGVPVICSKRASLPEIVGDGGYLIDPMDTDSIYYGIKKILEDSSFKDSLIKKGLTQASLFSWKYTALQTLEVYRSFCS